jgi:excisionase family DNA binding protein
VITLEIKLSDETIETIAMRAAEIVLGTLSTTTATTAEPYLTVCEAAEYLKLTPEALRARLRRGSLPGHRDDGRWLLDRRELDAHLHRSQTGSRDGATIQGVKNK